MIRRSYKDREQAFTEDEDIQMITRFLESSGRPRHIDEITKIVSWAHTSMLMAGIVEMALDGELDIDVNADGEVTMNLSDRRAYGSGRVYQRGSTWWIAYHVDGREIRESSGFVKKRDAEAMLKERIEAQKKPTMSFGPPVGSHFADSMKIDIHDDPVRPVADDPNAEGVANRQRASLSPGVDAQSRREGLPASGPGKKKPVSDDPDGTAKSVTGRKSLPKLDPGGYGPPARQREILAPVAPSAEKKPPVHLQPPRATPKVVEPNLPRKFTSERLANLYINQHRGDRLKWVIKEGLYVVDRAS